MPASPVVKAPPAVPSTNGFQQQPPATIEALLEARRYRRLPHNPLHDSAEVWQREQQSAGNGAAPLLLEAWRFPGDLWQVRVMFDTMIPLPAAGPRATAWASTMVYPVPAADLMKTLPRLEEALAASMRAMRGVRP